MKVRCGWCMTNKHQDCNPLIGSPTNQLTWVCACDCPMALEAAKLLEDDNRPTSDTTETELDEPSSGEPMHEPSTEASTGPSV